MFPDLLELIRLFFRHDLVNALKVYTAEKLGALFVHPHRLRIGRRGVVQLNRVNEVLLQTFRQERKLNAVRERDALRVHHVQQRGDEMGQTDIA